MKLRIRGNSLRLRLSRAEVARLGEGQRIDDSIAFAADAGARLAYAIVCDAEVPSLRASFEANEVCVAVPAAAARAWASGDDVGLEGSQSVGAGGVLTILVEKDFACLKPRNDEDESDAYPNPGASSEGAC